MDFHIFETIGSVSGSILTIVALLTLIIKPIRTAFINWISKSMKKDEIMQKLDSLSTLVEKTVEQNTELQNEMDKQSKALQASLRDSILNLYNKCMERGYITVFERQNLSYLYENYISLDGNSFVEECVEKLKNLRTTNE